MATELNKAGESHAESLIDAGKVDRDSAWSMSAADENALLGKDGADWDNYSSFHLGIKPDEAERTKARYAYPHGKASKVYRRALIAAESRAAQQGDTEIQAAAKRLLERIDAKGGEDEKDEGKETPAEEKTEQADGNDAARALRDMPRVAARIFGTPLFIAPQKLAVIMGAIGPRLQASEAGADGMPTLKATREDLERQNAEDRRALARRALALADADASDDETPFLLTPDGVAIIPIEGTLVHKSSWLSALSGMTSYGEVGASLAAAVADPAVKGILLAIDSYGGEVNGCFDLADAIAAARDQKPLFAVASDDAYSAAYALASASWRLFASRTSGVGSIGTVAMHIDQSAADKMDGLKYTYVYAGARKIDGQPHGPLTDPARDAIQGECDRLQQLFAASVAKYRGLSVDSLIGLEAACFYGEDAVGKKLADAIGTPADALAALRAEVAKRSGASATAAVSATLATKPADGAEVINLDEARQKAAGEARSQAVAIVDLCKLAGKAELASGFLARGLSEDAVRKALQDLKAESSASTEIVSHHGAQAGLDSEEGTARLWDRVIDRHKFNKA